MSDSEDDRRVLHIGGSLKQSLLLAVFAEMMRKEQLEQSHRAPMLIIDHRDTIELVKIDFEFTKPTYTEPEHIGRNCRVCGRESPGSEQFCSKGHQIEWKRRGR